MRKTFILMIGILTAIVCLASCKVTQRRSVDTYVDITVCPSEKDNYSTKSFDYDEEIDIDIL